MRVAVISCGSSVMESWKGDADIAVGINWAGERFDCDWLAALDRCVVESPFFRFPKEGLVGSSDAIGAMTGTRDVLDWKVSLKYETFPSWRGWGGWMGSGRCPYTLPSALMWACRKWAEARIEVHGWDMTEERGICRDDWSHGRARWDEEMRWMRFLIGVLGGRLSLFGLACQRVEGYSPPEWTRRRLRSF